MDISLPKLLVSSVVRAAEKGEVHGGLYEVEVQSSSASCVRAWDEVGIDWEGRGGDRGLRGIAVGESSIYLAASDRILVMDSDYEITSELSNEYLGHCHEIALQNDKLAVVSTARDSILVFDVELGEWTQGIHLHFSRTRALVNSLARRWNWVPVRPRPMQEVYDPRQPGGPPSDDELHLNNVVALGDGSWLVSGTRLNGAYRVGHGDVELLSPVPYGTHNVQPWKEYWVYNDTEDDAVTLTDRATGDTAKRITPTYSEGDLSHSGLSDDIARQGFARGLLTTGEYLVGGSSPATVSVYRLPGLERVTRVRLSSDVRNAIHGIAPLPG